MATTLPKWQIKKAAEAIHNALGPAGLAKQRAREIAEEAIGQAVPNDSWGPILFIAKAKKDPSVNGVYFPQGYDPAKVKAVREAKKQLTSQPLSGEEEPVELSGDLTVTVRGPKGLNIKAKVKKVILFFSVIAFAVVLLVYWLHYPPFEL